ncbi:hypothetical protein BDR26DRAFT_963393 [Obelidium mucronatum]|nr:hypothetical protein BDR26DRAFT_963393 [Obelidium mucronatum]
MALHYVPTVDAEKPRVFGMTASPISNRNASSNIQLSINQLETNLCSKAITADSHSDLQHYVISPTKTIVTYTPNPLSASSNILTKLEEQGIADIPQLRKLHSDARGVQEDFGAWVCDVFLRDAIFSLDKSLAVIRERRDHHLRKLAERESEAIESTFKDLSDDSIYVDDVACGADFLGDNPKREFYTVDAEIFEQLCASDENVEMEDGEISDTTPLTNQDIKGFEFNCSSPLSKNLLDTISGKFMSLVRVLQPYSASAESFCGIVFVEKRLTARLLNALIPRCEGLEFVRSKCLTGHSGAAGGSTRKNVFSAAAANSIVTNRPTEINTQKRILADFQPGKINLLIATKVAEEGIDIQPCNLVVRFDNVKTVISNIQSRGRARHKNSSYVLLVQEDDTRTIESLKTLEGDEVQMNEFLVNREEAASDVEPDSVLEHAINLTKDDIFEIPSGAKMSSLAAVSAIHQYCSLLPQDSFADSMPVFHTGPALVPNSAGLCEMGWVSVLQLPVNAPASCHFISGKPHRSKMGAKRSAAMEGVKRLYTDGSFDDFLRPVRFDVKLQSKAPSEDVNITSITGVESQVDAYCVAPYNVYIPQAFLQVETATNKIDQRYLVLFQLSENSRVLDMAVVLPFKLPNQIVDDTHILLIDKQPQSVRFIPCSTAIQVNGAREELIQRFTNAIFFNGLLRRTPPTSGGRNDYLLSVVPLVDGESALLNLGDSAKADELVDWDMLAAVSLTKFGELKQTQNDDQELKQHEPSAEALVNFAVLFQELDQELIVEDWAFYGRKFQVHAVLHHVSPYSVQFEGFSSLAAYYQQRLNVQDTILENQPVLLASLIPHMHQSGRSETTSRQDIVYLIPQFCTPYPIPFSLFTETACFMPILIQTLYHQLCTIEIQQSLKLLDYSTPALFQTALTSAGAQCQQDYERLEFLGDSFLKMYLSLHLFTLNPSRDEGWLSRSRVLLERNKNLLKMSIHNKLPNVLLCEPISRKTWLLPTGTPQTQHVSDKSAADLVESIVGACVVSTGVVGGGKAVRVFFGDEFEESLTAYSFRIESIRLKANMLGSSTINQNSNQNHQLLGDQLFKKLGYRFQDNNLALEALAHVSAIHIYGIPYCFQRLEFLGI